MATLTDNIYTKGLMIITFIMVFLAFSNIYKWNIYDTFIKMPVINVDDLQTGDIVLTRCNHWFPLFYAIKNVLYSSITGIPHTHVGIIYKSEKYGPFIIHYMINHQAPCILHNEKIGYSGLNMSSLPEFLKKYHGNLTVRRLLKNGNPNNTGINNKHFMDFIMKNKDKPFYNSTISLLNSAFKLWNNWDDNYFCSNFLVAVLKHNNVIDNNYNNITPADFAEGRDYKNHLKFINNYSLSEEHLIVGYPDNNKFY